ncbi:MAG: hypothetical protein COZ27_03670 [Candidatus Moranbacteria bacterium CG_4_10_14_3_um_filter_41_65]|nr:MAG: hypothetical protein AUK58_01515 [Candidatus Moranbacteria bacterium CG2_30_41_165]PIP25588.1 MAG: hypothetical protein COX32_02660 [Candidatus Moranbacteria bacterium CG23_combo_of_CG06-09_8_20_14_all_41_28]PIW94573.1 MAG: hypothetical protein COZ86_00320 [Candidatus Moranbacteria bacterium CG_4_8_14_3_um_filter_41_13]PIX91274.1 MAG: hypothetical protein COZ27_03670 [Candidatus Moranbacteria bacterium CG_4_10_14_3_um_filter_41_65]HCJ45486.1 hypothetical protein [Candidatus Moranbacteri
MTSKEDLLDRKLSLIAFFLLLLLVYTMQSTMCIIDASNCTFANGDWANWLFPKIQFLLGE